MKIIIILIVTMLIAGCEKRPQIPLTQAPSAPDPKASFEAMIAAAMAKNGQLGSEHWEDVRYDIRKTDSLVTPVNAELSLTARQVPGHMIRTDYLARLNFRDGTWELASLHETNSYLESNAWITTSKGEAARTSSAWTLMEYRLGLRK